MTKNFMAKKSEQCRSSTDSTSAAPSMVQFINRSSSRHWLAWHLPRVVGRHAAISKDANENKGIAAGGNADPSLNKSCQEKVKDECGIAEPFVGQQRRVSTLALNQRRHHRSWLTSQTSETLDRGRPARSEHATRADGIHLRSTAPPSTKEHSCFSAPWLLFRTYSPHSDTSTIAELS